MHVPVSIPISSVSRHSGRPLCGGMSAPDPAPLTAVKAFLVPTFAGAVAYLMAALGARYISPVPKHTYIDRIIPKEIDRARPIPPLPSLQELLHSLAAPPTKQTNGPDNTKPALPAKTT